MPNLTEELLSYARQGQILIARNKLLDLVYDTDDLVLTEDVNRWCRELYNNEQQLNDALWMQLEKLAARIAAIPDPPPAVSQPVLQLENVSKSYDNSSFRLQSVSLTIHQGEIIGIVGENGNGKTTLLNLVAQHLQHDSGNIRYPFLPGHTKDRYYIRQHIGFIPQRIPRWHGSLKESLLFAASCYGIYGKENEIRAEQIMHRMDLWKFYTYKWNSISSGYKTRFEIARVLLGKPKLLVLDEPLSNLDINTQQVLLGDLRNLAKSRRHPMGVLMSSQQLHEIENASDNIMFLKQGACIFQSATDKESLEGTIVEIDVYKEDAVKLEALAGSGYKVVSTGTFFVVSHTEKEKTSAILQALLQQQVRIVYVRDISKSAKRFFNN